MEQNIRRWLHMQGRWALARHGALEFPVHVDVCECAALGWVRVVFALRDDVGGRCVVRRHTLFVHEPAKLDEAQAQEWFDACVRSVAETRGHLAPTFYRPDSAHL